MKRTYLHGCLLALAVMVVLAGCAGKRPIVSGVRGGVLLGNPVTADRVYVICNMPFEYRDRIAKPLAAKLREAFAEKGIDAVVEVQTLNHLALGSGVDFRRAAMHRPTAIILARMGEVSVGTHGGYWNVDFDLFNSKGKTVWRGWASIYRLSAPDEVAGQLAQDLIRAMSEEGAVKLPEVSRNASAPADGKKP